MGMKTETSFLIFNLAITLFGFTVCLVVFVGVLQGHAALERTRICLDHGFYDYDEKLDVCYSDPFDMSEEYKPFKEVKEDKWFGKNCHLINKCLELRREKK